MTARDPQPLVERQAAIIRQLQQQNARARAEAREVRRDLVRAQKALYKLRLRLELCRERAMRARR